MSAGGDRASRDREQVLIDYMFSFAMRIHARDHVPADRDELAKWMRDQLASAGFETIPLGMSWAVLR